MLRPPASRPAAAEFRDLLLAGAQCQQLRCPRTLGAAHYFTVYTTPPVLYNPADNSSTTDRTPTLTTKPVSGARRYNFVVATDSSFSTIIDNAETTSTSYTPTSLYPVGPIYWKVSARDAAGNWGPFSSYRKLTLL